MNQEKGRPELWLDDGPTIVRALDAAFKREHDDPYPRCDVVVGGKTCGRALMAAHDGAFYCPAGHGPRLTIPPQQSLGARVTSWLRRVLAGQSDVETSGA